MLHAAVIYLVYTFYNEEHSGSVAEYLTLDHSVTSLSLTGSTCKTLYTLLSNGSLQRPDMADKC